MGSQETKEEKFKRIAKSRTNAVLTKIKTLGHLANKSNYSYSKSEVDMMFQAIEKATKEVKGKFSNQSGSDSFAFDWD